MEKIYKLLSVLGLSVILSVVGIFGAAKVSAENDFEAQQKAAEQLRESQKQAAEKLDDEQLRESQKQAAEESFDVEQKAIEQLRESQKQAEEDQKDVTKEDDDQNDDQFDGDDHKKTIDRAVRNLLNAADDENEEVSDKIKKIANEQNDTKDDVAEKIDVIKNRSGLKTFFIGADYKNLGQLRSDMVKTINQIEQLKTLLDKMTSTDAKSTIGSEVQTLEQEKQKIDDFIKANEDKFSLFGWFVGLFYK